MSSCQKIHHREKDHGYSGCKPKCQSARLIQPRHAQFAFDPISSKERLSQIQNQITQINLRRTSPVVPTPPIPVTRLEPEVSSRVLELIADFRITNQLPIPAANDTSVALSIIHSTFMANNQQVSSTGSSDRALLIQGIFPGSTVTEYDRAVAFQGTNEATAQALYNTIIGNLSAPMNYIGLAVVSSNGVYYLTVITIAL